MQLGDDSQRWDYLRHQIATASLHALPKVFTSQWKISKTTWLIVFFCACAGCGIHGFLLFKNFLARPTKVYIPKYRSKSAIPTFLKRTRMYVFRKQNMHVRLRK